MGARGSTQKAEISTGKDGRSEKAKSRSSRKIKSASKVAEAEIAGAQDSGVTALPTATEAPKDDVRCTEPHEALEPNSVLKESLSSKSDRHEDAVLSTLVASAQDEIKDAVLPTPETAAQVPGKETVTVCAGICKTSESNSIANEVILPDTETTSRGDVQDAISSTQATISQGDVQDAISSTQATISQGDVQDAISSTQATISQIEEAVIEEPTSLEFRETSTPISTSVEGCVPEAIVVFKDEAKHTTSSKTTVTTQVGEAGKNETVCLEPCEASELNLILSKGILPELADSMVSESNKYEPATLEVCKASDQHPTPREILPVDPRDVLKVCAAAKDEVVHLKPREPTEVNVILAKSISSELTDSMVSDTNKCKIEIMEVCETSDQHPTHHEALPVEPQDFLEVLTSATTTQDVELNVPAHEKAAFPQLISVETHETSDTGSSCATAPADVSVALPNFACENQLDVIATGSDLSREHIVLPAASIPSSKPSSDSTEFESLTGAQPQSPVNSIKAYDITVCELEKMSDVTDTLSTRSDRSGPIPEGITDDHEPAECTHELNASTLSNGALDYPAPPSELLSQISASTIVKEPSYVSDTSDNTFTSMPDVVPDMALNSAVSPMKMRSQTSESDIAFNFEELHCTSSKVDMVCDSVVVVDSAFATRTAVCLKTEDSELAIQNITSSELDISAGEAPPLPTSKPPTAYDTLEAYACDLDIHAKVPNYLAASNLESTPGAPQIEKSEFCVSVVTGEPNEIQVPGCNELVSGSGETHNVGVSDPVIEKLVEKHALTQSSVSARDSVNIEHLPPTPADSSSASASPVSSPVPDRTASPSSSTKNTDDISQQTRVAETSAVTVDA